MLSETFKKRLIGDYSFTLKVSRDDATEVLDWAKKFVNEIKQYLLRAGHLK